MANISRIYTMKHEIRDAYLHFFAQKQHIIPSFTPSISFEDATEDIGTYSPLLNSEPHAAVRPVVRLQDIEKVGDMYHTTFFEAFTHHVLEHASPRQQIAWIVEFLSKELGLDFQRVYVLVSNGNERLGIKRDEKTLHMWQAQFLDLGIQTEISDCAEDGCLQKNHILLCVGNEISASSERDKCKMIGTTAARSISKMFWDTDPASGNSHARNGESRVGRSHFCHLNCECGRFMEIGNFSLLEYKKRADGFVVPIDTVTIFTGWIERICAALNSNPDVFLTGDFLQVIISLQKMCGKIYQPESQEAKSFRIIADSVRTIIFLLSYQFDSENKNKETDAIIDHLFLRAFEEGASLGMRKGFLEATGQAMINNFSHWYKNLSENQQRIQSIIARKSNVVAENDTRRS